VDGLFLSKKGEPPMANEKLSKLEAELYATQQKLKAAEKLFVMSLSSHGLHQVFSLTIERSFYIMAA